MFYYFPQTVSGQRSFQKWVALENKLTRIKSHLQRKDADIVYKRLPELMEDLPPRGPPRPRPPETLLPLPPGRLLLSRWCRLSRSSSPANDQSLSSSLRSDSVSEGLTAQSLYHNWRALKTSASSTAIPRTIYRRDVAFIRDISFLFLRTSGGRSSETHTNLS